MDYIEVLKSLISIDSSVPPGRNSAGAIDFLVPLFEEVGFEASRVAIPRREAEGRTGRVNLICHRRQPGRPRLIFYAHIDVVPAQGWDAFKPRIEDGRIYGRGAADMKGGIAALLAGLEPLRGRPLRYDTSVMITTDEEYSQASQLRYLAPRLQPVSGSYFFNLDASFGYVGIASLGALHVDIRVKGRSVHSAMSHLGVNAVESAAPIMEALLALKSRVVQRKSRVLVHPETGLTRMQARLNINMIQGGLKVNIVPDQCIISVDRRLIPEESVGDARKELMETLESVKGVEWELDRLFTIPTVPPCEEPIVDELAGVIKDVTGSTGKFGEMGSGDLPHIVKEWGGSEFSLGVIRADSNIHGKDEFARLEDVANLGEIIRRFLSG